MANAGINRPFKFGEKDRREFIVENSEVSLVAINDTNGNPIYLAKSKVGNTFDEDKWQIRKVSYDENQGVDRVLWPENDEGVASSNYEFIWTSDTTLTITDITATNPPVVTVDDIGDLQDGDLIVILEVQGMTEVNFNGSNTYTVANSAGNTFELSGVTGSGYTAYTSGGEVKFGEFLDYTYS